MDEVNEVVEEAVVAQPEEAVEAEEVSEEVVAPVEVLSESEARKAAIVKYMDENPDMSDAKRVELEEKLKAL